MKKHNGNALVQYAIVIMLIVITVISVFMIYGKNIVAHFTHFYEVFSKKEVLANNISSENVEAGSLGGTTDKPVKLCQDNVCNIDYGDYVLTGIPSDFSSYIKSSGSSGATDQLADLLNQIASQLEQEGKTDQASLVRKLANAGHDIASVEKTFESIINDCNQDQTCVVNKLSQPIENGVFKVQPGQPVDPEAYKKYICIGDARDYKTRLPSLYNNGINKGLSAYEFVDLYDTIQAEDNLSASQKAVIKELYWHIGRISENVESGVHSFLSSDGYIKDYKDPLTGDVVSSNDDLPDNVYEIFSGYNPSSVTNLDSALICFTGDHQDSGVECH